MAEAYGKASDPEAGNHIVRRTRPRPDLTSGLGSSEADAQPADGTSTPDHNSVPGMDEKKIDHVQFTSTQPTSHGTKLACLPKGIKQALQTQLQSETSKVSYFALYRYADSWDLIIITISALCAIAAGAALPLLSV